MVVHHERQHNVFSFLLLLFHADNDADDEARALNTPLDLCLCVYTIILPYHQYKNLHNPYALYIYTESNYNIFRLPTEHTKSLRGKI